MTRRVGIEAVIKTNNARRLDIKVVDYKCERMRQKQETNLVVIVFEIEVGTRELGHDNLAEPVHSLANQM